MNQYNKLIIDYRMEFDKTRHEIVTNALHKTLPMDSRVEGVYGWGIQRGRAVKGGLRVVGV